LAFATTDCSSSEPAEGGMDATFTIVVVPPYGAPPAWGDSAVMIGTASGDASVDAADAGASTPGDAAGEARPTEGGPDGAVTPSTDGADGG
jgi:hypothetical protein